MNKNIYKLTILTICSIATTIVACLFIYKQSLVINDMKNKITEYQTQIKLDENMHNKKTIGKK